MKDHRNQHTYIDESKNNPNLIFDEKISFAKLRQRNILEGLPTYHDLVGEPIRISASKDQETGNYNITGKIKWLHCNGLIERYKNG